MPRSQSPIIAASKKIAANIVFGTLSASARIGSDLPSAARSARIDHTHPATHAINHASGTNLTVPGGNGTAVRYEKYAAPIADEASTTSSARSPFDICVFPPFALAARAPAKRRAKPQLGLVADADLRRDERTLPET